MTTRDVKDFAQSFLGKLGLADAKASETTSATDIPVEVWPNIFLYLDVKSLQNCGKVCRTFRQITKNESFWIKRSKMDGKKIPSQKWRHAAHNNRFEGDEVSKEESESFQFDYRKIVLSKRNYFNLYIPYEIEHDMNIQQHSDKYKFRYNRGGDGIAIQNNCDGCEPDESVTNCFAFSYRESCIMVDINLVEFGIEPWVLDYVRPKIRVTQKVNHRHDCGAVVALAVQMGRLPKPPTNVPLHYNDRDVPEDKSFGISRKEWEQWSGADWEDLVVEMDEYPSRMRHLTVITSGRDNQFWKGFYGPKIANLQIQIILPNEPILRSLREPLECEEREIERREREERNRPFHRHLFNRWFNRDS